MNIIHTPKLTEQQKQGIVELWNAEYPRQIAHGSTADLDTYLNKLGNPHHFLLSNPEAKIVGWLSYFIRDEATWFAMIVSASVQGKGYGTQLINLAKQQVSELNGWATDHNRYVKQNGETYPSPIQFYLKNGFKVLPEVRLESEKLSTVKIQWKSEKST